MKNTHPTTDTVSAILDAAEEMIRRGGYHATSYRDIAAAVSIKSASVHYHFPAKEQLGRAVLERYRENSLALLGDPEDEGRTPGKALTDYLSLYRGALAGGQNCLCGVLTMEAHGLPVAVREAGEAYLRAHADWVRRVLRRMPDWADNAKATRRAWLLVSALQGGLAMANLVEPGLLEKVIKELGV